MAMAMGLLAWGFENLQSAVAIRRNFLPSPSPAWSFPLINQINSSVWASGNINNKQYRCILQLRDQNQTSLFISFRRENENPYPAQYPAHKSTIHSG